MNINKVKEGSTLTVAVEGPLDIHTAPELSKALEGEIDDVTELFFDMKENTYTSSAGLRVILKCFQTLEPKGGRMVLKNVNDDFYNVLELSGFTSFLEIERA